MFTHCCGMTMTWSGWFPLNLNLSPFRFHDILNLKCVEIIEILAKWISSKKRRREGRRIGIALHDVTVLSLESTKNVHGLSRWVV